MEALFGEIPHLEFAQVLLRPSGERQLVLKPKHAIDIRDHAQDGSDLVSDLLWRAKDVRVVLHELAHASQPRQSARDLVPFFFLIGYKELT